MIDKRELEDLYLQFSRRIYKRVYYIIKNQQLAEEIVHDTFIKAALKLHTVKDLSKIEGWLCRIAINETYSTLRKINKTNLYLLEDRFIEYLDNEPVDELLAKETKDEVHQMLSQLSQEDLLLVTLYYFEQYLMKDIADVLDIPIGTVKSRLFRLRGTMKKYLTMNENERINL